MSELRRYGIKWNGPESPIATEMKDGYWTPFHIAADIITKLKTEYIEVLFQQEKVNCSDCDNLAKARGLSQETYCQSCIYQQSWRVNHFKKKVVV